MPSFSVAYSFDARAILARRVLPLVVTLGLWAILIEAGHLVAGAL